MKIIGLSINIVSHVLSIFLVSPFIFIALRALLNLCCFDLDLQASLWKIWETSQGSSKRRGRNGLFFKSFMLFMFFYQISYLYFYDDFGIADDQATQSCQHKIISNSIFLYDSYFCFYVNIYIIFLLYFGCYR